MGGFCLLVELHWEGSASAACAAGLFINLANRIALNKIVFSSFFSREQEIKKLKLNSKIQQLPACGKLFSKIGYYLRDIFVFKRKVLMSAFTSMCNESQLGDETQGL